MSDEDERMLWCGNLHDKATEALLYELFLQAGPVEEVKIPRDSDRRQRSYAFITYVHPCSVDYAINLFEGTALFQRKLTLHRKIRNGPNPAASPQMNFNTSANSNRLLPSHLSIGTGQYSHGNTDDNPSNSGPGGLDTGNVLLAQNTVINEQAMAMALAMNLPADVFLGEMLSQLGQQMLGAELPSYEVGGSQQSSLRTKMHRSDRTNDYDRHDSSRHSSKPYSRDDRRWPNSRRKSDKDRSHSHDHHRKRR
ncbi:RNA-binding protein 7 [Anopheles cruzii]|uniref:RNA-binding protein 7 n=1 Tax=Anopheles cruzii TaxID=68878 RepID=UPI0022EC2A35|nr:RNA-binding protein 7 [Anopheles cruzii]